MKGDEKQILRQALDHLDIPKPSTQFEKRLIQDWERLALKGRQPVGLFSDVLVLMRLQRKFILLVVSTALILSVFAGRNFLLNQEDDLNRIDVLSELSLSTL